MDVNGSASDFVHSQKALAQALGVTEARISQLKTAGRIFPGPGGVWCVADVRAQIAQSADLAQSVAAETRARARAGARAGDAGPAADLAPFDLPDALPPADGDPDVGVFDHYYSEDHRENYRIAQSLEKREAAAMARTERMKIDGLLVELADVKRQAYTDARMLRDRMMGLPTKLAPLLAPVTDAFELERMLREALRQVLSECLTAQPVEGA